MAQTTGIYDSSSVAKYAAAELTRKSKHYKYVVKVRYVVFREKK